VQQLYAAHASGGKPLKIESTAGKRGEETDLSAVLSADQNKVILFAVNATSDDVKKELDLSAFGNKGQDLKIWVVADRDHAGATDAANSFADPERVISRPGTYAVQSPRFEYAFPPLSLTVMEWVVQK
jgi:alpha-L-arabinofuranosidase